MLLEHAVILAEHNVILPEDLPENIVNSTNMISHKLSSKEEYGDWLTAKQKFLSVVI